jgi:hypothetical protein
MSAQMQCEGRPFVFGHVESYWRMMEARDRAAAQIDGFYLILIASLPLRAK